MPEDQGLDEAWPETEIEADKDFYTPDREGGRKHSPYHRSLFKETNLADFKDNMGDANIYLEYQTLVDYSLAWGHQDLADYWSAEQQAFVMSTRARDFKTAQLVRTNRTEQVASYTEQMPQQQQQQGPLRRLLPGQQQ